MTIIQLETTNGVHRIESQSGRNAPWLPGYIKVPARLEAAVWATYGYCDLTVEDGVLVDVTPTERPPVEEPEREPTEMELAQQDITDLHLSDMEQGQTITDLELMILGGGTNV